MLKTVGGYISHGKHTPRGANYKRYRTKRVWRNKKSKQRSIRSHSRKKNW